MALINPIDKPFSLEQICEANYRNLLRLFPDLESIEQSAVGHSLGKPSLEIKVLEKAPYTLTLSLSHCFSNEQEYLLEPAVKVRVYLDVKLVEVLRDHARPDVQMAIRDPGQFRDIMDYKWSLNYFLEKWLNHCLQTDYRFNTDPETVPVAG